MSGRCWKKSTIRFGLWLNDLGGSKEAKVFFRLDTIRKQRQFCDWVSDLIASYSPCWWGRDFHLRVMGWMHAQHPTLDRYNWQIFIHYIYLRPHRATQRLHLGTEVGLFELSHRLAEKWNLLLKDKEELYLFPLIRRVVWLEDVICESRVGRRIHTKIIQGLLSVPQISKQPIILGCNFRTSTTLS